MRYFQIFFISFLICAICPVQSQDFKIEYPGAMALKIHFSAKTYAPQDCYFSVFDSQGELIDDYYTNQLANQKLLIFDFGIRIKRVGESTKGFYLDTVQVTPIYKKYFPKKTINYNSCFDLKNQKLKDELYDKTKDHTSLGYRPARERIFGELDNNSGVVEGVYTGKLVTTKGIPNSTIMNTEHTWPKSKGAGQNPALSDIHHLFPTDSRANSKRSNFPFGAVVQVEWSEGGSVLGRDKGGYTVFMPRTQHRGDVARSMFYFSIRYKKNIPSYEEDVLKKWHNDDPVDQKEINRNEGISKYQQNRNPFIDHPEFVDQISDF